MQYTCRPFGLLLTLMTIAATGPATAAETKTRPIAVARFVPVQAVCRSANEPRR